MFIIENYKKNTKNSYLSLFNVYFLKQTLADPFL